MKKILESLFVLCLLASCNIVLASSPQLSEGSDGLNLSGNSVPYGNLSYDFNTFSSVGSNTHYTIPNFLLDISDSDIFDIGMMQEIASDTQTENIILSSGVSIPNISSYNPDNAPNNIDSQIVMVHGSNFRQGISANLTNGTYRQRNTTEVQYSSSSIISTSFNLQGLISGQYWIEVRNPDGVESPKKFNLTWGSQNPLNYPYASCVDTAGNVYVFDSSSHSIKKFSSNGSFLIRWGSYGSGNGQFNYPYGICADSSGNIYVADTGNSRIQKFNSTGSYLSQWGVNGSASGQFYRPYGICADNSGNIYVADTRNSRIQKFNSTGNYLSQWGINGSASGQLYRPYGVSADNSGNVYVADTYNNRIQKFNSTGGYQTQWGSYGSGNGQFNRPRGVCADTSGNVFVSDTNNHRIQKFSSTGSYLSQWGSFGSGLVQFYYPYGISLDTSGNVYVTDTDNQRIQKFSSVGIYLMSIGSPGPGNFNYPSDLCIDNSGNVYIADTENNRIQKFSSSGVHLGSWGSSGSNPGEFYYPYGICVDNSGNVYVADTGNRRIQKFSSSGEYSGGWGSPGLNPGEFSYPYGICVDSSGNVYVSDTGNCRIQKFSSSGVYLGSWGSSGSNPGEFYYPYGICVDSSENVYVSDTENHRIQKFSSSGVYLGSWGSYGTGTGQFGYPIKVNADLFGNIYVSDYLNSRIQKFSSSGVYLTEWGSYGTGTGQFKDPSGIGVDYAGNVYVTDTYNNRIQKFSDVPFMVTAHIPREFYWINASTGNGGSISPSGLVQVPYGGNQIFTLTPDRYNAVSGVLVDGNDKGALRSYNFTNVIADHQISAVFSRTIDGFVINATADEWTINHPSGQNAYQKGTNQTQIIQAKPGADIVNVLVDNTSKGIISSWTFTNISADSDISTIGAPTPGQVHALFNATPRTGQNTLSVNFIDQSTGTPTSWFWQFGDGNVSSVQNPSHLYTTPGIYTVTLRCHNNQTGGYGVWNHCVIVTNGAVPSPTPTPVPEEIVPTFSILPVNGTAPLSVQFTDATTGNPTSWFWDFGDGESSTLQHPSHQYTKPGSYSVTLLAQNEKYGGSVTKENSIQIT